MLKFQILAMEVMPDHIHLLVNCKPSVLCFRYDKNYERESCTPDVSVTSGAEKRTVGRTLVEPKSYCAVTVSDRSREQVSAYIEGQKEKKRKNSEYKGRFRNVCFLWERGKKMQTVSSYGVEARKQNIPLRQTLEIYRSGSQLSDKIYADLWGRTGGRSRRQKTF